MESHLANYFKNGKKKEPTPKPVGSFYDDYTSGRMSQGQTTKLPGSVPPAFTTPAGGKTGGGSGSSLKDFFVNKGIRSGQLQQQDNDFNSWLGDVQRFSQRVSGDYTKRQGMVTFYGMCSRRRSSTPSPMGLVP